MGSHGQHPRLRKMGITELCAPAFRFGQGGFRARGEQLALVFRHGGKDVDREPGGLRHAYGDAIYAALPQVSDEGEVCAGRRHGHRW